MLCNVYVITKNRKKYTRQQNSHTTPNPNPNPNPNTTKKLSIKVILYISNLVYRTGNPTPRSRKIFFLNIASYVLNNSAVVRIFLLSRTCSLRPEFLKDHFSFFVVDYDHQHHHHQPLSLISLKSMFKRCDSFPTLLLPILLVSRFNT